MSLGSNSIIAFVPTRDRERARAFFRDTLGLTLTSEDPFALVFDANGTMLRVVNIQAYTPAPFTILGWQVTDIAASVKELKSAGVVFLVFDGFGQDDLGIWTAPGGGAKVAWFKDPDGNTLSVSQH